MTALSQHPCLNTLKISCPFSSQHNVADLQLEALPPELVASALRQVAVLHLGMVPLPDGFWPTFFQLVCVETRLEEFQLGSLPGEAFNSLTAIPPELFAMALGRLRSVDLSQAAVWPGQVKLDTRHLKPDT
jgi:hypothetical protein